MVFNPSALKRYPLLRCLAIYRQMPGLFVLTALLFAVVNAGLAWQQWLVGCAVDDVTHGRAAVRTAAGILDDSLAWRWFAILVTVALVRGALQYGTGLASQQCNQRLLTILRARIFDRIQHLDLAYHRSHGMGELVTRTTRDADKVRDALVTFWRQGLETLLVVFAAVGLLAWYHPLLALTPLLLTVAGLAIFALQVDRLVALDRQVGAAYDEVNQDLAEGIDGVRVIKSFVLEDARIERFTQQVAVFVTHAEAALAYASRHIPLPQVVVALSHVWILVYGAVLVQRGEIALGALTASLLIATTLVFRLEGISRSMQAFADARSSAQRIWELLDAEPAVAPGMESLPDEPLGFRLSQVSVRAPGADTAILDRCSLTVRPGEVVALVGATGSGKSTLANLLPHLLSAEDGSVGVGSDSIGWHDVRRFSLESLRRKIHVVPQDSFLFSDTIAANLRIGAPDADDERLWSVLRVVRMDDTVASLPHGLDTPLGDRGVTLSGGQRQRLCLARALLCEPAVLVLDDATSALDAVTERAILDAIRIGHGSRDRSDRGAQTVLLITGKLSAVLFADRVAVLHQGCIDAVGTHAELAASDALYRDLLGISHG